MRHPNLFTNSPGHQDSIRRLFENLPDGNGTVHIACAFFTSCDIINKITAKGYLVNLVIRLGFPTSYVHLDTLNKNQRVNLRFYTSQYFHPKIYVFPSFALVGSANLTDTAINSNQEVSVKIDADNSLYLSILDLCKEYYSGARPISDEIIKKYTELSKRHNVSGYADKLRKDIESEIGNFEHTPVKVEEDKSKVLTKRQRQQIEYEKKYQNCRRAILELQDMYRAREVRKRPRAVFKVEFDSFISFIRDKVARGHEWKKPVDRHTEFDDIFDKWFNEEYSILDKNIESYDFINKRFSSVESISFLQNGELLDTLMLLHSVNYRADRFGGGKDAYKSTFMQNGMDKVKNTLSYLIHGGESETERMFNVIDSKSAYRLNLFGQSATQELLGWIAGDTPIVNMRTTKVLHYLGFEDIEQVSED